MDSDPQSDFFLTNNIDSIITTTSPIKIENELIFYDVGSDDSCPDENSFANFYKYIETGDSLNLLLVNEEIVCTQPGTDTILPPLASTITSDHQKQDFHSFGQTNPLQSKSQDELSEKQDLDDDLVKYITLTELSSNNDYISPYFCVACRNVSDSQDDLIRHRFSCDSSQNSFICYICGHKLDNSAEMTNHITAVHCDNNVHENVHQLNGKHLEKTKIKSVQKLERKKPKSFLCSSCNLPFKTASSLRKHLATHEPQTNYFQPQPSLWSTNLSLTSLDDEQLIKDVQQSDTNESLISSHLCNFCTETFLCEEALAKHVEQTHDKSQNGKFNCTNCNRTFSRERILENHFVKCINPARKLKQNLQKISTKIKNINLQKEKLKIDALPVLILEDTVVRPAANVPEQPTATITTTSTATIAPETAQSAKPQNKHQCTECTKMFATKQKMFRHMWIHRKKAFSCEICATSFELQQELDKHRLSKHSSVSPYTCTDCGKNFTSRQGLWEHNRIHLNNPNLAFTCAECNKTFTSRQGYLIHNRTHTGEKPFECNVCYKTFRDGGTLRKHLRIHTGERPHKCPLCEKGFNQKVVMREHIRWVHAANKFEYPDPAPYLCALCLLEHSDREELCTHIVKHSDQIAAFNREHLKQQQKKDQQQNEINKTVDKSPTSDVDPKSKIATNNGVVVNKRCDSDVIARNKQILKQYQALFKPSDAFLGNVADDGMGQHQCQICRKLFKTKDILFNHVGIHI